MVIGVMVWAAAHLCANGRLADVVLFGTFGVWAFLSFLAARRRNTTNGVGAVAAGSVSSDLKTIIGGIVVWLVFGLWLHRWLIGVPAFGTA